MGGSSQKAPDMSSQYAMLSQRGQLQADALRNQSEFLRYAAGMIPQVSMPDISGQNERILNQSIANAYQGRNVEKLFDPSAAAMRANVFPQLEKLTSPEATAARQNQWLKTSGLQRVFGTGTGLGTFGASGLADAGTEQGFQNMLRNLQIQQGALGAAPSVGINPSAAASQVENAKAQQAAVQNAFQQGILQQGSGLMNNAFQSGQSMADAAMRLNAQDIQNQLAAQQANQNMFGSLAGAGIGALGTIGGASFGGPFGAALGGGLGSMIGNYAFPQRLNSQQLENAWGGTI
jgi:hypothetical protein